MDLSEVFLERDNLLCLAPSRSLSHSSTFLGRTVTNSILTKIWTVLACSWPPVSGIKPSVIRLFENIPAMMTPPWLTGLSIAIRSYCNAQPQLLTSLVAPELTLVGQWTHTTPTLTHFAKPLKTTWVTFESNINLRLWSTPGIAQASESLYVGQVLHRSLPLTFNMVAQHQQPVNTTFFQMNNLPLFSLLKHG